MRDPPDTTSDVCFLFPDSSELLVPFTPLAVMGLDLSSPLALGRAILFFPQSRFTDVDNCICLPSVLLFGPAATFWCPFFQGPAVFPLICRLLDLFS